MSGSADLSPSARSSEPLSGDLARFVDQAGWVFARTYADTWPHYYIVRDRVDTSLFLSLVEHIRRYGYRGWFYQTPITYFDHGGHVYWTMVPPDGSPKWYPPEEETIVNRCRPEQTYHARLRAGKLPENRSI